MPLHRAVLRASFLLAVLGTGHVSAATWSRARTQRFVLVGDASPSVTGSVARSLERFRAMVEQETSLRFGSEERIVYVFEDGGSLRAATGAGREMRGLGGAFSRNEAGTALVAIVSSSDLGLDRVRHELVHELIDVKDPPRWLDEGLAQYLSSLEESREGFVLGMPSFGWGPERQATCPRLPVASLLEMKDYPGSERETCGFYATSALLVQLLAEKEGGGGIQGLLAFLDAVGGGTSSAEALRQRYDLDVSQLDVRLRDWVGEIRNARRLRLAVPWPEAAKLIRYDRLPPLEHHLLLGDLHLSFHDSEGAAEAFRKARRMAPDDLRAISGLGVALGLVAEVDEALPLLERTMAAGHAREGTELAYAMALLFRGFERGGADLQADHGRARELARSLEVGRHNRALHGLVLGFASLTDPSPEGMVTARTALEGAVDADARAALAESGLLVLAARAGDAGELARLKASEAVGSKYLKKLSRTVATALREASKDRPDLAEQAARVEALAAWKKVKKGPKRVPSPA